MSTLAVNAVTDANGGNTATINSMTPTADSLQGFRNRIINGDMRIDQRNAGAAVTGSGDFPVDRFVVANSTDGAFSAQQDSSAPAGFVNSLKVTATTADGTLTTTQSLQVRQPIEGTNVADLGWGTANAKTVTISFWVRSSLTGTFGGSFRNNAFDRSYPFTYSISVADTWEYKSVTIPGDTTGTWLTTTGIGVIVTWGLGSGPDLSGTAGAWAGANYVSATGAVSVIGTLNATWYITGVQLEVGSVATPFERRPYGTELALCQRYFQTYRGVDTHICNGGMGGATSFVGVITYIVEMRATPTFSATSGANYFRVFTTTGSNPTTVATNILAGNRTMTVNATTPDTLTAGHAGHMRCFDAGAQINFSAEL